MALMLIPLLYSVLTMFFMRIPPPEGREVSRAEAPKLFEIIDKMRKRQSKAGLYEAVVFMRRS